MMKETSLRIGGLAAALLTLMASPVVGQAPRIPPFHGVSRLPSMAAHTRHVAERSGLFQGPETAGRSPTASVIPTDTAIQIAAPAMAALIDGPCWLVPVPASDGSLTANFALARAIAEMVPGARVKCAIGRAHPVESSNTRSLRGLPRLTIEQHAIIRTTDPMKPLPVYFVDNAANGQRRSGNRLWRVRGHECFAEGSDHARDEVTQHEAPGAHDWLCDGAPKTHSAIMFGRTCHQPPCGKT